jgi:hypothetical protein
MRKGTRRNTFLVEEMNILSDYVGNEITRGSRTDLITDGSAAN